MLVWAAIAGEARAGAWTQEEGRGLVIATVGAARAATRFDDARLAAPNLRFRKVEAHLLAEYGISDRFTLQLRSEARMLRFEARPDIDRTGLGFTGVAGRYKVIERGPFVGSLQGSARVAAAADLPGDPQGRRFFSEYEARALAGYAFTLRGWASFVGAEIGYRLRDGLGPDEILADLTLGTRPVPSVLLLLQSFSTIALGDPASAVLGYDHHKLQASAVFDWNEAVSVQAGAFTTLSGRNALREEGVFGALWRRF